MRDYEEKSYYEIQLDNKQLILVFLAGVTVCVLVFILGVMVGKGKKEAEMVSIPRTESTPTKPQEDLSQPQEIQPTDESNTPAQKEKGARKNKKDKTPTSADQQANAGPNDSSDKMAYNDLDKTDTEAPLTPAEKPKADTKQQASAAKPAATPVKAPAVPQNDAQKLTDVADKTQEPDSTPAAADTSTKTDGHFTVQVMATGSKDKATQQLNYLKTKGYTAFMSDEKTGSGASVYKVRVGKFADSDSAKKVATRLKQELKLETWVAVLE